MEYRYCPMCAAALGKEMRGGRERPVCPQCGFVQYVNPVAGVAGIVLLEDEHKAEILRAFASAHALPGAGRTPGRPEAGPRHILLARRRIPPDGWCIPCGYVEGDEEIRQALVREMEEETGLEIEPVEVFTVQSNFHNPESPTVGTWFLTRVRGGSLRPGDDVDQLGFFPVDNPPPLAFPTDEAVLRRLGGGS
ncbi:MAG: NUDIX domain-containing protein [Candidatus Eisenbacteria bacterium]|nr:NUDIX domain-containing protein [Candidatus Eisenbacteria bacterium]